MTVNDDWSGTERRQVNPELAEAVAQVRELTAAAANLAKVHHAERIDLRQKILVSGVIAVVLLAVLTLFINRQNDELRTDVQHGHDELSCVLLVPEAERTAAARLDCREATR